LAQVRELFDLGGRVAVVTGGSAGLGLQMATALAEAGSNIVICSRKAEHCEQAAEQLLHPVAAEERQQPPLPFARLVPAGHQRRQLGHRRGSLKPRSA